MNTNSFLGLRTTIYKVSDLNTAKQWYEKAFQCTPYFDEDYYVGFSVGGYELGLQPNTGANSKESSHNVVSYWGCDAIHEKYDYLLSIGAKPHEAPFDVGGGIITATVLDPFNNILGLIYNPHFNSDIAN